MLIISNPVNSTVPIVAEVFKKAGVYDPKKYVLLAFLVFSSRRFYARSDAFYAPPNHQALRCHHP